MNFEFPEELIALRDEFRGFVADHKPIELVRRGLDGQQPCDLALWKKTAELGWTGTTIAEAYGGTALGYELLCLVAEECGRTLVPLPFSSAVYLASEAIQLAGTEAQKQSYLPRIVAGAVATFALAEGPGDPDASDIKTAATAGSISGVKMPVLDADVGEFAVVAAREGSNVGLYLVDLRGPGVERQGLESLDPSRSLSKVTFKDAPAERLGEGKGDWSVIRAILERAAILLSFEQLGGAQACLDMATEYAKQRYAFGRPIGSFQAIKHRLADVYVAVELARANAYYGAWAISAGAADLAIAAASTRVCATAAFEFASKENIQVHGGVGCTWEYDCHLYYRRSKLLGLMLGGPSYWKNYLIDQLEASDAGKS